MDGMRVAVYLLYLMHVLYIWAVALCCAGFAAADSGPNTACVVWTPAALIFPALKHVVRVIVIFVPKAYLLLLATAALCCLLVTPANSLHPDFCLHVRLLHLQ